MAQSINREVDLVMNGVSFHGLDNYGKIMVGDAGFEFYNDNNVEDYIQIPWTEVDYIIASVVGHGKKIPRFAVQTKKNGTYSFSAREPKKLLAEIRKNGYVPSDHLVRSLTLVQVIKKRMHAAFSKV
ncbi:MAG: DUF956 family protein [Lachnospiraceae bacterium]